MAQRSKGLIAVIVALAIGVWAYDRPYSSAPLIQVKDTKVAVDRRITPEKYRQTHITVDFEYRPSTIRQALFGPVGMTHHPIVELPKGAKLDAGATLVRQGLGISHDIRPVRVSTGSGRTYRYTYGLAWVGKGTLVDTLLLDGKAIHIKVPFDERRNVPRPTDMTAGAW